MGATIKIIKHYDTNDTNFTSDCNQDLFVNDVFITGGDEYHDDISRYIEGYIAGFKYACIGIYDNIKIEIIQLADNMDWD